MKKLLYIIAFLFLLTGCADKRLILIPQNEYYPTFPTEDFKKSEKYSIDMLVETKEINGSMKTYLITDKVIMLDFMRDVKILRSNYNILLTKINEFNSEIRQQNKIQNEKKPYEIESINDLGYK